MANEKVSQLTSLTALEISPEDVFLVGDISARESKKMTADQLLAFVEESGSFDAVTAVTAQTASYVAGGNVVGTVSSASYSTSNLSSSWASRSGNANTASMALTASYVSATTSLVASASFLVYSANNGSASYAIKANTADNATQTSFLVWSANNGSASFATRSFFATSASYASTASVSTSASYASTASVAITSSFAQTSSFVATSSFALNASSNVKAWAMVTWSIGATGTQPSLYLNHNVSTVAYVSNFTDGSYHWYQYGITFDNLLTSTNYVLLGDGYQAYGNPERANIVFHPVYSNRTTASCTMSLCINPITSIASFFAGSSASYHSGENTFMTFQILGN